MIIKSHIRGGYTSAAQYLKEQGQNEQIRLVHISDPDAKDLHHAFHNMWTTAAGSKVKKPLHHISINPMKGERLTDEQVHKIIERAEQKYGYKPNEHQRVIVEHVLNGRQHFHVMWNRVSLKTGKAVWPGHHWKKSKQVCREMEKELGLMTPVPRSVKKLRATAAHTEKSSQQFGRYQTPQKSGAIAPQPVRSIRPIRGLKKPLGHKPEEKLPERPFKSTSSIKGWPPAAIADWESWGHRDPARFFKLWRELSGNGVSPSG